MIANLCLSNKPVVSSRVLYDVQHTHSTSRDEDNLWDTDNQYCYVGNGSWRVCVLL